MIRLLPQLYIGGMAEFGDASTLQAAGIELAIATNSERRFPHAANLAAITVQIDGDARHPQWLISGLARLIGGLYLVKTIGIFDEQGGLGKASYLVCCAYAQRSNVNFSVAETWLNALLQPARQHEIPVQLMAQGRGLWP